MENLARVNARENTPNLRLVEQIFAAESDSELLKLEKLLTDLQKNFKLHKIMDFPVFRVSNVAIPEI